jgi:hypothetical protein
LVLEKTKLRCTRELVPRDKRQEIPLDRGVIKHAMREPLPGGEVHGLLEWVDRLVVVVLLQSRVVCSAEAAALASAIKASPRRQDARAYGWIDWGS